MSLNDFEVVRKLGEGAYSSVFKVLRKSDGQDYAMKSIKMGSLTPKERDNAVNEVRFLASVNCQEIVGYKEAFYEEKTGMLHIIMEYCAGGDFLNKIRTLKKKNQFLEEKVVWMYITQMIRGLKQLHDLHILHRDIKCANIMLSRDHKQIKVGDLNVSKVAKKGGLLYTQTGTPYYASPEVWRDKPYNSKSDVWSLGCVIYEMITLSPPFKAVDMEGLYKQVQKGVYEPLPRWYSQELTDFIELCLQVNPKSRLTTAELLQHPLLNRQVNQFSKDMSPKESTQQKKSGEMNFYLKKDTDHESSSQYFQKNELLKTLRYGNNLQSLNQILPTPQYYQSVQDIYYTEQLPNIQPRKQSNKINLLLQNASQYQMPLPKNIQRTSSPPSPKPPIPSVSSLNPKDKGVIMSRQIRKLPTSVSPSKRNESHNKSRLELLPIEMENQGEAASLPEQSKVSRSKSIEVLALKNRVRNSLPSKNEQVTSLPRIQEIKNSIIQPIQEENIFKKPHSLLYKLIHQNKKYESQLSNSKSSPNQYLIKHSLHQNSHIQSSFNHNNSQSHIQKDHSIASAPRQRINDLPLAVGARKKFL